jgi:hypothetical protein
MRTVMLDGLQAGICSMTVSGGNVHNIKEIISEAIFNSSDLVLGIDI